MINIVNVASRLRKNTGVKLLSKISIAKMQQTLLELFFDEFAVEDSVDECDVEFDYDNYDSFDMCYIMHNQDSKFVKYNELEMDYDKEVDLFIAYNGGDNVE
ncbi:hypothetical protein IKD48_00115 [bacterium]|nr:hypothetical protein [bacterium]